MKITKKLSTGGTAFARKAPYEYENKQYEADLQDGDTVKILDSGNIESSQWGDQTNFKIETRNGEKKIGFNQATQNVLHDEFGEESESWVGKEVRVILKKDTIAGKKVIIAYFVTGDWQLDEYGELVNPNEPKEEVSEDDINPEDIEL